MDKENKNKGRKKEIKGVVTGNKMGKTVKVTVSTLEAHPMYKKIIKKEKVFFAHTEEELEVGTKVMIKESKPISKKVRWLVVEKEE
ncbi:mitochondrial small ribosomal subunit protein uS17m [Candidatus Dojkabacteria bacterium]|nr:30S ribosomal protein S17 [Candidatus Dojkabacteria bacterium]NLB12335.1 mitochondrial small ribosomal subunit protein uS17m [Candidatus Dojkabacteria bacterium]